MSYIQVEHLQKTFTVRKKREKGRLLREKQTVAALEDVSFQIEKGELVGYIGPNGAGKSTTVKILSGILTPDSGDVRVGGRIPWEERREHVRKIGVVFGQRMQLWWDVPILDSYELLREIYRLPEADYRKRLAEMTEALQLGDLLRTPLRDFLRWENRTYGTTVMLTTHDMEDIAALCSRVMVLGHGRKLYDGDLPALLAKYDTSRTVTLRFEDPSAEPRLPEGASLSRDGELVKVVYAPQQIPTPEMVALLQQTGPIREMTIQPQNIDVLIAAMYREMDL